MIGIESKRYRVSVDKRDIVSSESFLMNEEDELIINGKTFEIKDILRINIQEADRKGSWDDPEALKEFFDKTKK